MTPAEALADRMLASALAYEARTGSAGLWAPAIRAWLTLELEAQAPLASRSRVRPSAAASLIPR